MLHYLSNVLDRFDEQDATCKEKLLGCLLWLLIIGTFSGCCLYLLHIFS